MCFRVVLLNFKSIILMESLMYSLSLPAPLCRFKKIIPVPEQSMIQMLCYLLECLLTKEAVPADCPKEIYELYFVFAAIWAFGSSMVQDQVRWHVETNGML